MIELRLKREWGTLQLGVSSDMIDILPRITIVDIRVAWVINIAFLMLSLNMYILGKEFRELDKNTRRE